MAALRSRHEAEALAARLPPLLVQAERVAATVAQGVHGRRRVGSGDSFWQFRAYVPGDPVTRIDWRETAKSERAYVRENEWEAAQSVWLWHDRSPSMNWRSDRNLPTKGDRAALLLLALAALLVRGGERVALVGAGLPPAYGRAVLDRLALTIERSGEALSGLPRVEAVRDQYQARLAAHRDGLAALARSHGWSLGLHRTDHPPHQALLALYGMMSGGLPPGHAAVKKGA